MIGDCTAALVSSSSETDWPPCNCNLLPLKTACALCALLVRGSKTSTDGQDARSTSSDDTVRTKMLENNPNVPFTGPMCGPMCVLSRFCNMHNLIFSPTQRSVHKKHASMVSAEVFDKRPQVLPALCYLSWCCILCFGSSWRSIELLFKLPDECRSKKVYVYCYAFDNFAYNMENRNVKTR